MAQILRLKQELAELHIPLIVIAYDSYSPRREVFHTSNSAIPTDQQVYNGENYVTPQRRGSLQDTSVQVETVHPIAQILISLCSPSGSSGGTYGNRDINIQNMSHSEGDYNTVTPGPETVTNTYAQSLSTLYKSNLSYENTTTTTTSIATDAQSNAITTTTTCGNKSEVVLITDDVLHPLQRHVHRAVTVALPALSLLAVDSPVSNVSTQVKENDLSNLHNYEQFCIMCESQKDARRDANHQELSLKVVYYESFLTFCSSFLLIGYCLIGYRSYLAIFLQRMSLHSPMK